MDPAQVRELLKRNKQLEQENEISAARRLLRPGHPPKVMFPRKREVPPPLVRDLAVDGVPVAVTCRVLGFSKQAFYAWRACPVTDRDWSDAHLLNAAIDIHHDDPEFGYLFITDELAQARVTWIEKTYHPSPAPRRPQQTHPDRVRNTASDRNRGLTNRVNRNLGSPA